MKPEGALEAFLFMRRPWPSGVAVKGLGKVKEEGSTATERMRPVSLMVQSLAPEVVSQMMMLESAEPEMRISLASPLFEILQERTLFTKSECPR